MPANKSKGCPKFARYKRHFRSNGYRHGSFLLLICFYNISWKCGTAFLSFERCAERYVLPPYLELVQTAAVPVPALFGLFFPGKGKQPRFLLPVCLLCPLFPLQQAASYQLLLLFVSLSFCLQIFFDSSRRTVSAVSFLASGFWTTSYLLWLLFIKTSS